MWNYIVKKQNDDADLLRDDRGADFVFKHSKLDVAMMPDRPEQGADTSNSSNSPRSSADQIIRYAVADLLRGGREAVLEHGGSEYRLRITANGRLILTK